MAADKILASLPADIGAMKKRADAVGATLERHSQLFEQLLETQTEMMKMLNQVQVTTTSLASSVGLAMSELAVSRALERRVERLEAAVFPPKH